VKTEKSVNPLSRFLFYLVGLIHDFIGHFHGVNKMVSEPNEDPFEGIPLPTRRWE